jgi:2-polyprenyl-3-methyl-5-hydroxy-6-metoxy-1,4-benzoquinol methylase
VGHVGLSEPKNLEDYAAKAAALKRVILASEPRGNNLSLLDCGCGTGALSVVFEESGFAVTGIDFSESAIIQARQRCKGRYLVADLTEVKLSERFDWVVCVDVLFHVVDDRRWRDTLRTIGKHVANGGRLLIQENLKEKKERHADHVKWRTFACYVDACREMDFGVTIAREYEVPSERVRKSILIAKRTTSL